jgi:hypothetical protein
LALKNILLELPLNYITQIQQAIDLGFPYL